MIKKHSPSHWKKSGINLSPFDITAKIGIGTVTPDAKIQIVGNAFIGEDTTNFAEFENDGTLKFNGTATFWEDVQFPISGAKVPAANFPDFATFTTNTMEYKFDINDYIDLNTNEMPHWWKVASTARPHLHLALDGANVTGSNRYAQFTLYIAYADKDEVWSETSLTAELIIPTGTADRTHVKLSLGDLSLVNNLFGTQVKLRVKRIAATGGTEYPNHLFITQVGIHAEGDTVGSRQETVK